MEKVFVGTIKTKRGNYIKVYQPANKPTEEEIYNLHKAIAEIIIRDKTHSNKNLEKVI